ncbi:MAG: hypothetical protein JNL60_18360 [Bacteroidia bacterium]|nr:hypothetical protein [Bacteroidia bacterium]
MRVLNLCGFIFCALLLYDCRKDRTCNCSITLTKTTSTREQSSQIEDFYGNVIQYAKDETNSTSESHTSTSKVRYTKVKKNQINELCPASSEDSDTQESSSESEGVGYYQGYPFNYPKKTTVTVTIVDKTTCKIE